MAILSKIRDRSMFLIIIIGLALFAFVLDPSSIQNFFSASKINSIGEVNGEEIDREEFASQVEAYRSQTGGRATQLQAGNVVWENMVSERIFKTQLERSGIVVGEKDIWDAMIALPDVQNSPLFKNEVGLFDEEKLKEYVANLRDEADAGNTQGWLGWLATEKSIIQSLERQAYTQLVSVGLGVSLKEGERDYMYNNTKMNAQFVYVPYTSIADSLITIKKSEAENYIADHASEYKVEEGRDIQYVKFDIVASEQDEAAIKAELDKSIEDREEYSSAAKATVTIPGFKNVTNDEEFVNNNKSDLAYDGSFKFKIQLPATVADELFEASAGTIVGPYKDNGYFKLSKVSEITSIPDSVKASHILIPFAGSRAGASNQTEEQAKQTADSIVTVVKRNKTKFAEIAKEMSADKSNSDKGGDLNWFGYSQMVPEFRDYCFENKKGNIGIVKTIFGYHIIKIDDQKNDQKALIIATLARKIEASEETENAIFQEAETFFANLSEGKNFTDLSVEKSYDVKSAVNLKVLDENIPGLFSQRQIVQWAFNDLTNVNDTKRFDIDNITGRGYAVVILNEKIEKGLAPVSSVIGKVRPILMNQKKAELIKEKMEDGTLEDIAAANNTSVRKVSLVTLASPTLSGVGSEPAIVGALSTMEEGKVVKGLEGNKGVFAVKLTKRELPVTLENYNSFSKNLGTRLQARTNQLYNVLKESSEIVDYRGKMY